MSHTPESKYRLRQVVLGHNAVAQSCCFITTKYTECVYTGSTCKVCGKAANMQASMDTQARLERSTTVPCFAW